MKTSVPWNHTFIIWYNSSNKKTSLPWNIRVGQGRSSTDRASSSTEKPHPNDLTSHSLPLAIEDGRGQRVPRLKVITVVHKSCEHSKYDESGPSTRPDVRRRSRSNSRDPVSRLKPYDVKQSLQRARSGSVDLPANIHHKQKYHGKQLDSYRDQHESDHQGSSQLRSKDYHKHFEHYASTSGEHRRSRSPTDSRNNYRHREVSPPREHARTTTTDHAPSKSRDIHSPSTNKRPKANDNRDHNNDSNRQRFPARKRSTSRSRRPRSKSRSRPRSKSRARSRPRSRSRSRPLTPLKLGEYRPGKRKRPDAGESPLSSSSRRRRNGRDRDAEHGSRGGMYVQDGGMMQHYYPYFDPHAAAYPYMARGPPLLPRGMAPPGGYLRPPMMPHHYAAPFIQYVPIAMPPAAAAAATATVTRLPSVPPRPVKVYNHRVIPAFDDSNSKTAAATAGSSAAAADVAEAAEVSDNVEEALNESAQSVGSESDRNPTSTTVVVSVAREKDGEMVEEHAE